MGSGEGGEGAGGYAAEGMRRGHWWWTFDLQVMMGEARWIPVGMMSDACVTRPDKSLKCVSPLGRPETLLVSRQLTMVGAERLIRPTGLQETKSGPSGYNSIPACIFQGFSPPEILRPVSVQSCGRIAMTRYPEGVPHDPAYGDGAVSSIGGLPGLHADRISRPFDDVTK